MRHILKIFIYGFLSTASVLQAEEISVDYASTSLQQDAWYLDAGISFSFHDEVIEALNHGVDLNIDIEIIIKKKRKWFWDRVIKEGLLKFKLEHHPLANLYIVTNLSSYDRTQFEELEDALGYLGTINQYLILDASMIEENQEYTGSISAKLNVEDLPPPLKPVAYISSQWQADSETYSWVLQ